MHKLKESNQTIPNTEELAETFNTFFSEIVPNLNIDNNLGGNIANPHNADPVFCAIKNCENHPSIQEMMSKTNLLFPFKFIDRKNIFHELQNPNSEKTC